MMHLKFFCAAFFLFTVLAFACKTRSGGIQNENPIRQETPASTATVPTEVGLATDSFYADWTLPPKPQTIQFRATDTGAKRPSSAYQLTVTD